MRTTRENPSEAPMAIMRDPDQLGSQRAAKPRLNQEQSYLAFSPPGHRSGHWPVKHSSSTQIQIGFFTLFREMCKLCSLLARARFSFLYALSPRHRQRHQRAPLSGEVTISRWFDSFNLEPLP